MRRLLLKIAGHAHARIVERTPLPSAHVDELQRAVDAMDLPPGTYHWPLRHAQGHLLGYAQFKSVPNRKTPVLATVLGPEMRPAGYDIEALLQGPGRAH